MFTDLSNKWRHEIKFAGDPDFEFVIYTNDTANSFVKNDTLHIKPTLTEDVYGAGYVTNKKGLKFSSCTGFLPLDCEQTPRAWQILPPIMSAQISTINSFSFLYGTIEVKAKFPRGDWLYPEISLVSKNDYYGPGLESGRIRIAFSPGNEESGKYLYGGCTLGYWTKGRKYGIRKISSKQHWFENVHTYKLEWKPDGIILYVDNEVYGTIRPPYNGFASENNEIQVDPFIIKRWQDGTNFAPFDQEMYIVIGVGAGGQIFLEDNNTIKPWDNDDPKAQLRFYQDRRSWISSWNNETELLVKHVKVWAV
ncbi:hypothetical protein FQA39_LY11622 [Lamprigera yunnana]|nr:hypothetical protein FQA39_LY11622 [Lamprigera yunnana]